MARYVGAHGVLRAGERGLLLLSGGADSMALLHLLPIVGRSLGLELSFAALHVDYGMRDADSDRDRDIVAEACAALRVPLHVVRLEGALAGPAFQERARQLRYRLGREIAATHGHDVLVTGHNRDDQAETVLYRLTKYASPRGLMGMRPREGDLARPLLCLGAAEIRSYCAQRGVVYGQDVTNLRACYARNVIRLEVLPRLRRINPRVAETLAAGAEIASGEAGLLGEVAAAALARALRSDDEEGFPELDVATLLQQPPALRALVLHDWLRGALGSHALIERRVVEALQALLDRSQAGGRVSLRGGLEAERRGGRLRLRRRMPHTCADLAVDAARLVAPGPEAAVTFCGRSLRIGLRPGPVSRAEAPGYQIGLADVPRSLLLRHPRRGDRFAPLGLGAETTVVRFLAAARVPADLRSRALVLEVDGVVVWVGFVGPDGRPRGRVAERCIVDDMSRWTLEVREEDG